MEIGSAYALQVCLLQIPAMVGFSAWYDPKQMGASADTFTFVEPIVCEVDHETEPFTG
jgi:Ca2+:H+ antiporter